jgi:hypothetical protein
LPSAQSSDVELPGETKAIECAEKLRNERLAWEIVSERSAIRKEFDEDRRPKTAGVPHNINTPMRHSRELTDEQWKIPDR